MCVCINLVRPASEKGRDAKRRIITNKVRDTGKREERKRRRRRRRKASYTPGGHSIY
jgi:hypothetical protein